MKNEEMALLFSEATPYIQKYHGKTLVIKYGGNAMVNDELKLAVMNDLVTLTLLGVRVVLVHGGGPAINQMLKRVGKESRFVGGLRYTDEETMGIVQQVLAGQVNKDLVALLKGCLLYTSSTPASGAVTAPSASTTTAPSAARCPSRRPGPASRRKSCGRSAGWACGSATPAASSSPPTTRPRPSRPAASPCAPPESR